MTVPKPIQAIQKWNAYVMMAVVGLTTFDATEAQAQNRESQAEVKTRKFRRDIRDGVSSLTLFDLNIRGQRTNEYCYKFGPVASTSCSVEAGYSTWTPIKERLVEDISQTPDGNVILCLLGRRVDRKGIVKSEQSLANATAYTWSKDTSMDVTPPAAFTITGPVGTLNTNTPEITWAPAGGADYYDMSIASDNLCQTEVQTYLGLTATSQILTQPLADGDYFICVEASDLAGNSTVASNNAIGFTVDAIDDIPPGTFSITDPSGNLQTARPTFAWEVSSDAVNYTLSVATDSACNYVVLNTNLAANTYALDQDLADGVYYTCVTSADDAGNTTTASNNGLQFEIDAIDDIPPGTFDITGPTGTSDEDMPTITWTASVDAVRYVVFVGQDPTCNASISAHSVIGLSYQVETPLPEGEYVSCVFALDAAGNQTPANNNGLGYTIAFPDTAPPGEFTITGPSGLTYDEAPLIEWTVSLDAVKYELAIATDAGCVNAVQMYPEITGTSFQIPAPLPHDIFYSCVTSFDAAGNSTLASNNGLEFEVKIPMPERHEIFVTPGDYSMARSNSFPPHPGVISHLGDADWHCSYLAAISKRGGVDGWDPTNQQAGTPWKAVLGIPGINAYSRIFIEAPVYDTTGQLLAADHNELWSQGPRVPVMFDPVGLPITGQTAVWTGSGYGGQTIFNETCSAWNDSTGGGATGDATLTGQEWISGGGLDCTESARLYCISPVLPAYQ